MAAHGLVVMMTSVAWLCQSVACFDCSPVPITSDDILFYNRIPKAGGTSLVRLAHAIADSPKRPFSAVWQIMDDRNFFDEDKERSNVGSVMAKKHHHADRPMFYEQHVRLLNFSRFGYRQPIHINIVREPTERVQSSYYYQRYANIPYTAQLRSWLGEQFDWSINKCIEAEYGCKSWPWMIDNMNLMVGFFCGHHEDCRDRTSAIALERAQANVLHHYAVVGVTERYNESVWMLSQVLPTFFKTLPDFYEQKPVHNANNAKPELLTDANRRKLLTLGQDERLYDFIQGVFMERLAACRRRFPEA
ncbi:uncharacterized protein MONBRDRAFT_30024 [Monosiga brevicollis MX1]|uniref:Sulfotransferase domain-containing protein n=1 Tax=Monosiga brevicollis TaxID=81824 RepID=A9VCT0_MONBE|nr:uncharacterized protein MONBRDRAFT_30024 [Monosiga brevicollis MX1]EDQ84648.1 predicted protein [Monosiga brevicollis MX1]|eukprot:XP_001750552.1 hypothetical protein [Monosiga brevicollis MX1]